MKVVSFFAGCGGLDLGFEQAGFHVVWANELEPSVYDTYVRNHPYTHLELGDICKVCPEDIPDCDGFIGGPPCQSWSVAGRQRGLDDSRGQLFLVYIGLINAKKPKFFLIENVKGILSEKFKFAFDDFISRLESSGYDVHWKLMDAADYGVPQNRERVFIIGFRKDLNISYVFPGPVTPEPVTLYKAIGDITEEPVRYDRYRIVASNPHRPNHDVYTGSFGPYYMFGNRRRPWERPSFTIHATGENAPLHPSSPKMIFYGHEKWGFQADRMACYRRLSVRECARIQTFPDSFIFESGDIRALYRMIGNAVPPRLGKVLAKSVLSAFCPERHEESKTAVRHSDQNDDKVLVGYYKSDQHLEMIEKNRMYYVRSDGRKGSVFKMDCQVMPRFLMLHHKDNAFFYDMDSEEPTLTDCSYLRSLGFDASGDMYLSFRLLTGEKKRMEDMHGESFKPVFNVNSYHPYFIRLGDLINLKQ